MTCQTCARSHFAQNAVALDRHEADVPREGPVRQDPLPEAPDRTWVEADIAAPTELIAASELTVAQPVSTVSPEASSSRGSDKRGGAKGAWIRLHQRRSWEVDVHMLAGLP